jgi:hypothetical protein
VPKSASPSPRKRTWSAVALTVTALTGGLLASGSLDPVLGDAVTAVLHKDTPPSAASKTQQVADWQYFDDRPEWSSVRGVPQVPAPTAPSSPRRPAIAPPEDPIHFQFAGPPPMPHYSLKPLGDCPQQSGPGHYVENFTSSVGKNSVTLHWFDLGDPDIVEYDIYAIPQFINVGNLTRPVVRPASKTKTVAPPRTCKQMTATISGLTQGEMYQVFLESKNKYNLQQGTYMVTRGETETLKVQ